MNIQFLKKVAVSKIAFYLDYSADESYTPKKILIKSGTCLQDLVDVTNFELVEPTGWVSVILKSDEDFHGPLRTYFLQVKIISMHQNGKDTHIRQIRVYGQKECMDLDDCSVFKFQTVDMSQYAGLR